MINSAQALVRETGTTTGTLPSNHSKTSHSSSSASAGYANTFFNNPITEFILNGMTGTGASGIVQENIKAVNMIKDMFSGDAVQNVAKKVGEAFSNADFSKIGEAIGNSLSFVGDKISNDLGITGTSNNSIYSSNSGSSASSALSDGVGYNINDIMQIMKDWRDDDRAWNAAQAQKQMDFQERMARNAHTYEMEDLKNAGLNPVLAAGANSGAAAPNGSSASSSSDINTIAQIAMMALETAQVTSAAGMMSNNKNGLVSWLSDKNVMNAIGTVGKIANVASTVMHLFGA